LTHTRLFCRLKPDCESLSFSKRYKEMKRVACFLALLLSCQNTRSMDTICSVARFCDTHPIMRTVTSSILVAGLLTSGDYCESSTALLAAWHLNTAYDLGSLCVKKYTPTVVREKQVVICLTSIADLALIAGPTLYKSATEYLQEFQNNRIRIQEQIQAQALKMKLEVARCQNILKPLQNNPLTNACTKFCTDHCWNFCNGPLHISSYMNKQEVTICGQYCIENCDPLCTSSCKYY
jgi:hypothetical protein